MSEIGMGCAARWFFMLERAGGMNQP